MAQCKTFPSPERCSEWWSVLSATATRRIALCQKTGYPEPRQHFCTQRPGSAASLAQGHSIQVAKVGQSFRSTTGLHLIASAKIMEASRVIV